MSLEQKINLMFVKARIRMDARIYGIVILDDLKFELLTDIPQPLAWSIL